MIIALIFCSCSHYITQTSYRPEARKEYFSDCGYKVSCNCYDQETDDPGKLLITVFTPQTWGKFYSDFLEGDSCTKVMTVESLKAEFPGATDTLLLERKDAKDVYYFSQPGIKQLINAHPDIKIRIRFAGETTDRIILLHRHRKTYKPGGKGIGGC